MKITELPEAEYCNICNDELTQISINGEPICTKCMTPGEWDEVEGWGELDEYGTDGLDVEAYREYTESLKE